MASKKPPHGRCHLPIRSSAFKCTQTGAAVSAILLATASILTAACSDPETSGTGGTGGSTTQATGGMGGTGGIGGSAGMLAPPDGSLPEHSKTLPFDLTRADVGTPITNEERTAATGAYLDLLNQTKWFDTVAHRAHGWPSTDPNKRYHYGTWWSGVTVKRENGKVTFTHSPDGADNNGLRSAQLLEGACYAAKTWNLTSHKTLAHRLLRGFTSWFLAMEPGADAKPFLMARAAYPESVESTETPIPLFIDYSASRPGIDAEPSAYIHLPNNPYWPDLWTKNKRSKDDIGHLVRAVGELDTCDGLLGNGEVQGDIVEMRRRFEGFSRDVAVNNFVIPTLDKDLKEYLPPEGLAHFIGFLECSALLSLELTGYGQAVTAECGDGYDPVPEGTDGIKSGAMQIVRAFHAASVQQALVHGQNDLAKTLLGGMVKRLDTVMDLMDAGTPPSNFNLKDLVAFMVHAANAGVPLTSREVRWLQGKVVEAQLSYSSPAAVAQTELFSPNGADGDYAFEPGGEGIDFKDIGLLLGLCAAQYKNPTTVEVFDCSAIAASAP
ncbi:MAG: hypothetical protein IPK82_30740 [Polyangiaceae bacterium]|nr:hypothetical protein [Polyangiaceae bacterium]